MKQYKIAILVLYSKGWQSLADIVLPNIVTYCQKQGYEFLIKCSPEWESDYGYNKLLYIQEIFSKTALDVVWSLDLDTFITNHNIRVEDFIQTPDFLYLTKDLNGINCGSFIIKKSDWTKDLVSFIGEQKGKPGMYCEQNAIEKYIEEKGTENICFLEHPSINSYLYENYPEFGKQKAEDGQWVQGCFLLHLPGLDNEKRTNILNNTVVVL